MGPELLPSGFFIENMTKGQLSRVSVGMKKLSSPLSVNTDNGHPSLLLQGL